MSSTIDSTEPDEIALIDDEAAALDITGRRLPVHRTQEAEHGVSALVWGEHPDAVFLHGGGLNAHTWDATLLALHIAAVALDLPGHGHSAWRDDADYRSTINARTIGPVVADILGGRRVPVVGQSLGGSTGIALAADRPDLVSALVLVDVSPGLRPGDAAQVRDFLAGPVDFASRDEIVERALAAGIGSDGAALARGVALNTRVRDDGRVVFRHHLAGRPQNAVDTTAEFASLWQPLEALDVPVLLVRGRTGFLSDDVVAEFRDRLPRAQVIEVDTGHNVQEQRPLELAEILRTFFAGVEGTSTDE